MSERCNVAKMVEAWQPLATAPKDGTVVRLLVNFTEHPLEDDDAKPLVTIGGNSLDNTGEDRWQFVGWSWIHDCFTDGEGEVIGWLPMVAAATQANAARAIPAATIDAIIRDIGELPDYDSPDEWPDALMATAAELRVILERHLASHQAAGGAEGGVD